MQRIFQPGFRLSKFDILILVSGTIASLVMMKDAWQLGTAVAFVVLHFFLFCNVFRIPRRPELIWAAGFVTLVTLSTGSLIPWTVTFILSLLLSCVLIALEARSPNYHGIFWATLNPNLKEHFEKQHPGDQ